MNETKQSETTEIIDVPAKIDGEQAIDATPNGIIQTIEISDYSQFLSNYTIANKQITDFTAEGIKTIALQYGISTGEVDIKFLDEEQEKAIFKCTATNVHTGQTASVNVFQSKEEHGKENKSWIEKGTTRAIRNAQKSLLPIELLKTALTKAISQGQADESELITQQRKVTKIWKESQHLYAQEEVAKREIYDLATEVLGDVENWDAETWRKFGIAIIKGAEHIAEWESIIRNTLQDD